MSFVKDDYGYTRSVGAIDAMDAVSPNRNRAAIRAARAMAVRDRIMAMGAIAAAAPVTTRMTSSDTSQIETGQEAAFSRPPPPPIPVRTKLSAEAMQRRALLATAGARLTNGRLQVKSPGSVLPPPPSIPTTPIVGILPKTPTALPPTKPAVTIVAGGSGTSWTSGKASAAPSEPPPPPPDSAPDPESAPVAAPAKKSSSNLLLYAGLGIGVLWLLTREK